MTEMCALYGDGGVIGPNPSPRGGTWAFTITDHPEPDQGKPVISASGLLLPHDIGLPLVTNNHSELAALVYGLEALPYGWYGTVASDSKLTLERLFGTWPWRNIPIPWVQRAMFALGRLDRARIRPLLLSGHPTRRQLATGVGKRGTPVSVHNQWADSACQAEARGWVASEKLRVPPVAERGD